jgi:hypothetical protein
VVIASSRRRTQNIWLAGWVLPALLAAACQTVLPPGEPDARTLAPGDPRPEALLRELAAYARDRSSLRGLARLSLDGPAGSGRAKQILMLERPDRLRVEVLGFLNQTVALLTTDGRDYRLFRAEDRSWSGGPLRPGLLWEVAGIALTPAQAVSVLLGTPEPPEGAELARAAALADGGLRVELDVPVRLGRLSLEFDTRSHLRRWSYRDADGAALFEVRFGEYRLVEGRAFAHAIELYDRVNGTEAKVSFASVELNPIFPPEVFVLERGGAG